MRPASIFFIIQLSNSRYGKKQKKNTGEKEGNMDFCGKQKMFTGYKLCYN